MKTRANPYQDLRVIPDSTVNPPLLDNPSIYLEAPDPLLTFSEVPQSAIDFELPVRHWFPMAVDTSRTTTVTVYKSEHRLYTRGNGFVLEFHCLHQSPPLFEVSENHLRIDATETSSSLLSPFEFPEEDVELIIEDVDLTVLLKDGSIEFVQGFYSNLPIYSPYYAVATKDDLYEVETLLSISDDPSIEGDELLSIPDRNEPCVTVTHVGTGWAGPVSCDRLQDWFEEGRLHAAIPVELPCCGDSNQVLERLSS